MKHLKNEIVKPCPCFAWQGFLLFTCLSVCVSVHQISQKLINQSTLFSVGALLVIQGGNHLILKNCCGVRVCVWGGGNLGLMIRDGKNIFWSGCNS